MPSKSVLKPPAEFGAELAVGEAQPFGVNPTWGEPLLGFLAWAFSVDRSNLAWRVILWGIGLQLIFAVLILKTPMGAGIFWTGWTAERSRWERIPPS